MPKNKTEIAEAYAKMKRLCQDFINEDNEDNPDYGALSMDIAYAAISYLVAKGDITLKESNDS